MGTASFFVRVSPTAPLRPPSFFFNSFPSHFTCVAETNPADPVLTSVIEMLAPKIYHVHARVGYDHGPQVQLVSCCRKLASELTLIFNVLVGLPLGHRPSGARMAIVHSWLYEVVGKDLGCAGR